MTSDVAPRERVDAPRPRAGALAFPPSTPPTKRPRSSPGSRAFEASGSPYRAARAFFPAATRSSASFTAASPVGSFSLRAISKTVFRLS